MTKTGGLNVAIVGSGPSGFYAAEALFGSGRAASVDMMDRLAVPFGLVRYGVAPDHQKLKQVTKVFARIASDPRFRFFGNVNVGRDVSVDELRRNYSAVIIAAGASSDRKMGIPNEDILGSYSAVDFVGWYNGHPDYRHLEFDLSSHHAVIVGQGNVAIDVCRILAKPASELAASDIAPYALDALSRSNIRTITIVGRRGPLQAKFTTKELHELGELPDWRVCVDVAALQLNETSATELLDPRSAVAAKNFSILKELSARSGDRVKSIRFLFQCSPHAIEGARVVEGITFERTVLEGSPFVQRAVGTGMYYTVPAGAVFRSVGYEAVPFPGLPFDDTRKTIRNQDGRVCDAADTVLAGIYVTGWIKRGPTGIIGTNRVDSIATVSKLLEDTHPVVDPNGFLERMLPSRGVRWTTFDDWQAIDALETQRGAASGRIRCKIIDPDEMLGFAGGGRNSASLTT